MKNKKSDASAYAASTIESNIRKLHDLRNEIRTANFNFEWALDEAEGAIKAFPELVSKKSADTVWYIRDQERHRQGIYDLTLEGAKCPFFTEGTLFELLGKEDARTVLAAIAALVERSK